MIMNQIEARIIEADKDINKNPVLKNERTWGPERWSYFSNTTQQI